MERFLWICLAGATGTGVRYLIQLWTQKAFGPAFPFGTLIVNVVGSFLLALLMHVALASDRISPGLRLVLATGFLGGLTTYSSFNYETLALFEQRAWGTAGLYLALTLLGCLLAGGLGLLAGRALLGVD
jgi:fluoride exporter